MSKILERLEYGLAGAILTLSALYLAGHEFVDDAGFVLVGLFVAVKVAQLYTSHTANPANSRPAK